MKTEKINFVAISARVRCQFGHALRKSRKLKIHLYSKPPDRAHDQFL